MKVMRGRGPNMSVTDSYFYLARNIAKCMMRADALNSHVYPVRTEMDGTQQIPNLYAYSKDERIFKRVPS